MQGKVLHTMSWQIKRSFTSCPKHQMTGNTRLFDCVGGGSHSLPYMAPPPGNHSTSGKVSRAGFPPCTMGCQNHGLFPGPHYDRAPSTRIDQMDHNSIYRRVRRVRAKLNSRAARLSENWPQPRRSGPCLVLGFRA